MGKTNPSQGVTIEGQLPDDTFQAVQLDADGKVIIGSGSVTSTPAVTTGTATATADNTVTNVAEELLAAAATRKSAVIQWISGGNVRVAIGEAPTTTKGFQLGPGNPVMRIVQ